MNVKILFLASLALTSLLCLPLRAEDKAKTAPDDKKTVETKAPAKDNAAKAAVASPAATNATAQAAKDEKKDKEKPKKVSQLMEKANDLMSMAQESYVDGNSKQAISQYREALKEIERVENENPERADSAEFAPLRFRKALCETEIDRIMLEEVTATSRTVAVTDTTELEKKRAERKKAAETNHQQEVTFKLSAKKSPEEAVLSNKEKDAAEKKDDNASDKPIDIEGELEFAKDMQSVDRFDEAQHSLVKVLKAQPENREARFLMGLVQVQSGHADDATVVLDDILADNPKDESALLLSAAAHTSAGQYSKALDNLDAAMKVNPKRPEGYHDMAWLLLEMKAGDVKESEAYYRQAIKLGGARDRDLERRLGIKDK